MIRQAISCDVCSAEKKQTNHWYVVCEQAGELRLGGWNSRMRQRPGAKHLCGQICLHKLVDEFMARTSAARAATAETADTTVVRADADTSLTSASAYAEEEFESSARLIPPPASAAYDDFESSARLIPTHEPIVPRSAATTPAPSVVVPMPQRLLPEPAASKTILPQIDDTPNYSSRRWRAEAWERERNREMRAVERHPRSKGI